ncbi:hypothetical protein Q0Z83_001810 [Actinoplanes sichuanensis]|uniref:Uncharacterized protein n=1 Tax=Actinoplanes sichuanensis TaxID=512349 RepID=A0ABW4ARP3_9ACTN|nr:hypothetical protein [Actinoplanes sichuanensis]BEL01990.1 hypothetical protein Q0Z83_001810 [Actinoplanes sichuanensis]
MEQAEAVPLWQEIALRVSQALLGVYLLGAVALAVAVATGRATLSPTNGAYLIIPAIAFGQAVWNTTRARRADDTVRRDKLARIGGIQVAIGVVIAGQLACQWIVAPQSFTDW